MSRKFFGEHGKRYFLCRVCSKVLKAGQATATAWGPETPMHCGRRTKFITDLEARERVEGKKKGRRMKGKLAMIEASNRQYYGA